MRTSTLTGLRPPTASTAPSCSARSSFTWAASGNSLISSRNSVPPEASTNLPVWRSVAPVKAPFSWPNRIDSTRLSGIAPQLTATNGFDLRSPLPWMARANNSLPTPDSPSISTGMVEAAAFCAVRSTPAMGGLHDDGDAETGFTDFGQYAHAVEAGHHQIEHDGIDHRRVRRGQPRDRRVAGIDDERLVATLLHHVFDQTARYRVVIGDQNAGSHGFPPTLQLSVSNRGTLADGD